MKFIIICPLLYCTSLTIKKRTWEFSDRCLRDLLLDGMYWHAHYERAIMLFPGYLPAFTSYIAPIEPLLNVKLKLRAIPAILEINALREVLWQRVGKFPLKSIIALCQELQPYPSESKLANGNSRKIAILIRTVFHESSRTFAIFDECFRV